MIYVYYRLIENVSPEKAVQLYQQAASVFEVSGDFLSCEVCTLCVFVFPLGKNFPVPESV